MKNEIRAGLILVFAASMLAGCSHSRVVTFDDVAVGTKYGLATGFAEGAVAVTEDGIPVSVHDMGGDSGRYAEVYPEKENFGSGNIIWPRAMNLEFDFTGLDFTPCEVTFIFLDWGGREYISVNSAPEHTGELTEAPSSWPGGITMTVTSEPTDPNPHNKKGKVVIEGSIQTLRVGGQEFFVDNIRAKRCGG